MSTILDRDIRTDLKDKLHASMIEVGQKVDKAGTRVIWAKKHPVITPEFSADQDSPQEPDKRP
jgi:TRAP-type C4-dicarboxylate transport system substrate-binding protein